MILKLKHINILLHTYILSYNCLDIAGLVDSPTSADSSCVVLQALETSECEGWGGTVGLVFFDDES